MIPEKVIVTAKTEFKPGLAISLKFGMSQKNDYYYIAFLDNEGKAQIGGDELLRSFDQSRKLFGMDYKDPRTVFTGQIEANVLSKEEIEGAIRTFNTYKKYKDVSYPPDYLHNLEKALTSNADNNCAISVQQVV